MGGMGQSRASAQYEHRGVRPIGCGVSTDPLQRGAAPRGTVLAPCRSSPSTRARAPSSCDSSAPATSCSRRWSSRPPPGGRTARSSTRHSTGCFTQTRSPIAWSTAARGSADPCDSTPRSPRRCGISPRSLRCTSPPRLTRWPRSPRFCRTDPAVACLDTAFHSHLPDAAATYALPRDVGAPFVAPLRLPRPLARLRLPSRGRAARPATRAAARSAATSAPAPRWQPSTRVAPSTRRWASPRSRASSWLRARAASIPVCCSGFSSTVGSAWMRCRTRWSIGRAFMGSPARATCGRCSPAPARVTRRPPRRETSTCIACEASSPRWPPHWGARRLGLHRRRRRTLQRDPDGRGARPPIPGRGDRSRARRRGATRRRRLCAARHGEHPRDRGARGRRDGSADPRRLDGLVGPVSRRSRRR